MDRYWYSEYISLASRELIRHSTCESEVRRTGLSQLKHKSRERRRAGARRSRRWNLDEKFDHRRSFGAVVPFNEFQPPRSSHDAEAADEGASRGAPSARSW
ncbi:hypothetical protein EVAR_91138_1 [Eumeta japonica]|uniref:Uncharacterized protein n=1 Tax=Eumeta variegata TaxID=151549 RepID=A0A4C2A603_EUMVA|nr:hypothetical protein EVAR_91138_1 [Eumeta japonica]